MNTIHARSSKNGFTIVELIVVIVVIGILAAITIVSYNVVTRSAKEQSLSTDTQTLASKLTKYKSENGAYPSDLSSFTDLGQTSKATFQYTYNSTDGTYCATGSIDGAYVYVTSTNSSPKSGGCPGHGVNGQVAITNLSQNPSMEVSTAGWGAYTGVAAPTRVTTTPYVGSARLSAVGNNTSTSPRVTTDITPLNPGDKVSVSFYVRSDGQTPTSGFLVFKLINGTTEVSSYATVSPAWSPAANGWMRVQGETTVPSGGNGLRINFGLNTAANYTGTLGVDGVMIVKSSGDFQFADGNASNWVWNGTENLSTSTGPQQ